MVPELDNKHYTIKFTCNFSTTIPCHPKSSDVGQIYKIDKACPQCLPHPYLVNAIFDRAHYDEVQALKKAQGEATTEEPSTCDINQSLSDKLRVIDDDSRSVSGMSVASSRSIRSGRQVLREGLQILKSVVTRPRRRRMPTPVVKIIITPPEEDVIEDEGAVKIGMADSGARDQESCLTVDQAEKIAVEETIQHNDGKPAVESAEKEVTSESGDSQWESFLKKANELQSQLQQDKDEETKRKEIEQKLEEAEREVLLEKVKAVEICLEQLS